MKYSEFSYKRPDIEEFKTILNQSIEDFKNTNNVENAAKCIDKYNAIANKWQSLATIASINYSKDTANENYVAENEFFDQNNPVIANIYNKYYKALIGSKFKPELKEKYGNQLFDMAEMISKTVDDKIVDDLKAENKLGSEYMALLASAKIPFQGEELNLSGLTPYFIHEDRNIRHAAHTAKDKFFSDNAEKLDEIYDKMVHLRTNMAKKLGFSSYTEMAYAQFTRTDYDAEMVKNYREQIYKHIVPITTKIRKAQKERIGLEDFYYHDEAYLFPDGNPKPHGNPDWIVNHAKTMYKELSPETHEFFQAMLENDMMDLVNRKGKAGGGYCTYIPEMKSPFIFSNFNGTQHDIEVLTHEAGHAFQAYSSRHFEVPEYGFPTMEAAEIHSMSMEFLTWNWMKLFFEDDTKKFKYAHLAGSLLFLPYGATVDEFQHWVYANPDVSLAERHKKWAEIEHKYLPHRQYSEMPFYAKGGYWQQQGHIYRAPFYYIDYTLAQVCAFQFWKKAADNREKAWEDYLRLCKAGGSQSFLNLVKLANLESPFNEGCIEKTVKPIVEWLESQYSSEKV